MSRRKSSRNLRGNCINLFPLLLLLILPVSASSSPQAPVQVEHQIQSWQASRGHEEQSASQPVLQTINDLGPYYQQRQAPAPHLPVALSRGKYVKLSGDNGRLLSRLSSHLKPANQLIAGPPAAANTSDQLASEILQGSRRTLQPERFCMGTSNGRTSSQHNKSENYEKLAERYRDCTYVMGNLEITWLDKGPDKRPYDLSFLESIREITGYLLIANVEVESIRMPNLQIIRGRDLFKMNDEPEEFAMILIENELRTLELPNLREILAGSVGSFNNRNLCHIRTINWDEILNWPMYRSVFVYNGTEPECPPCDGACQEGYCWATGGDMCQKLSKKHCSPGCGQGRCFGPSSAECCHSYCAGGCTGPRQTDCLACKNFYDDGECIAECPSMQRYNPSKFLWETNPNGKYAYGATCVKDCPKYLLRDNGACVRTCPPNKRSVGNECVPCAGPCQKNCQGVEVVHSGNIDQLINCTVIEGSLTILDKSFTGFLETSTSNSGNSTTIRHKPMHPSRLEVFKTLREITGSLRIEANHSDFKNLSYFRNLMTISGRQMTDMLYALSITKTSLVSLNLRSLRKVRSGRVIIEENSDLCFADTIDWLQINLTRREDIITRNNAESSRCRQLALTCHEQCARDGCWGPGPDECLSCNNYKLDDYCVDNCTASQSVGFLSYDVGGRTCKRCHPECKGGCSGSEACHCLQCKSFKDGPYCVSECPSHKYNNGGTCEECDRSCPDGCTGPSSRLGEGGCNSCAKAVINSTDSLFSAYCIEAKETCPEGYYQEYVGPQAEGPLKSSSGKPVCRKCHHRCKSCTGMGTHASVCECAKYLAGEQCEDYCPRDYFADEQSRQCVRCSPECNGCFGPTEADCATCRVYRIYYDSYSSPAGNEPDGVRNQVKFNCTAQCPSDKPHRISESNMLDPYCSEDPGLDPESPRYLSSSLILILLMMLIISVAIWLCVALYRCEIEKDKTVKLTMHLSGIDDVEPLHPSNFKPNLAALRSIKETELRKGNILGSGFGGTVYQGFWFPEGREQRQPRPVAIKVLRDNGQSNEFLNEAFIMASVKHQNLVSLLAVCTTPNHLMLVTPLMPLGCLLEYVKKHKSDIGSKNLLEWCKQIARGMAYLEERRMVHRDLALRNVLLQKPGRALISDFGLAKFLELDQSEYHSGGGRLPIKWLAPECIRERKFTHKSDVWAFGVTVWELLTFGARPFEEYDTKDVPLAIEKGARLRQPSYMSAEVYKVMYACWFYNPEDRPNFKALAQNFVNFARDPERYLICGSKGLEYASKRKLSASSDSSNDEDEYDSDVNSLTEEEASQPPLSAMPNLTPSTHNQLNEMFGFELRQHLSESDQAHLSTPTLKKLNGAFHGSDRHLIEEDVFTKRISASNSTMLADANNNTSFLAANNCCPMHHTLSSSDLGRKSEQPTDMYDYLLPSPCTDDHNHFSTFYSAPYEPKSTPISPTATSGALRNPPHSAGPIGVNNDEYFLTRANYANQQVAQELSCDQMSSASHLPQSLV